MCSSSLHARHLLVVKQQATARLTTHLLLQYSRILSPYPLSRLWAIGSMGFEGVTTPLNLKLVSELWIKRASIVVTSNFNQLCRPSLLCCLGDHLHSSPCRQRTNNGLRTTMRAEVNVLLSRNAQSGLQQTSKYKYPEICMGHQRHERESEMENIPPR